MSAIYTIIGPPGTGKTTTLSRQAGRAAAAYGTGSVVIASLTRAAAHEVAGRNHGIAEENVGTMHAHAYRALDTPDLAETPEGIALWNADHPAAALDARSRDDLDAPGEPENSRDDTRSLHDRMTLHRARLDPPDTWAPDVTAHAADWAAFKRRTRRLDFADLIDRARELGPHPVAPRGLFLDEAQDFSASELALAREWAQHTETTVLVGDPRQAIFQWRGADPAALRAPDDEHSRVLADSYRVPRAVHAAAERWASRLPGPPVTYRPRDADGEAQALDADLRDPASVLDALAARPDGTLMLLATSGYMLRHVLAELRSRGIPYHNPHRPTAAAWNPLRAAEPLRALRRVLDRRPTWRDLAAWTGPLDARATLARGARTHIDAKLLPDRFGESEAEREVPYETLASLLGIEDHELPRHPAVRGDDAWWETHLRASERARHTYPLTVLRAHGDQALIDTPRLCVGTGHSTKGGECDHCFVAPDLSPAAYWSAWHAGGPGRDAIVRLGYVMLTRARESIGILAPSQPEHAPLAEALG